MKSTSCTSARESCASNVRPRTLTLRQSARRTHGALSLVEGSVAVGLIGTMLAVFAPTFFRELRTSKVEEASIMIDRIANDAATYYAERHRTTTGSQRRCLPSAAGPTPETPAEEPRDVDFALPPSLADGSPPLSTADAWQALGTTQPFPLRFSYTFTPVRSGCALASESTLFSVKAQGDLDGDGEYSTFAQDFRVEAGRAVPTGPLRVNNRVE